MYSCYYVNSSDQNDTKRSVVNISRDMTFFKLKNLEKTYNYIKELEPAYYDSLLVGVSHMTDKIDCYL